MLTALLENILNRGLPRSPRARQLCAELAGRRIRISVPDITGLLLESTGQTLKLGPEPASGAGDAPVTADATITGGPLSLLGLAGAAAETVFQRGAVQITGDTDVAAKFRELALLLRPEPEEELSQLIGDLPAHQLGRFARAASAWTRRAAATSALNIGEYLGHETRDLVPRSEADVFLRDVDTLREDVDRIAARLALLAS